MLIRIILLPIFRFTFLPLATAHYGSIRKAVKHWILDGCKDVKLPL